MAWDEPWWTSSWSECGVRDHEVVDHEVEGHRVGIAGVAQQFKDGVLGAGDHAGVA